MRRVHWLWLSLGLLGLLVILGAGGVWSLRRWPEQMVPRLPITLAIRLVTLAGDKGRSVIGSRLGEPDAQPAILAALNGSRERALLICQLLDRRDGSVQEPARQRLYELANDPDVELRKLARGIIAGKTDRGLRWLARQVQANRWVADGQAPFFGIAGRKALALSAFVGSGYDHRMPSRYKKHAISLLGDLLALQDPAGRFAIEPRENAVVVEALASCHAMSNDPALDGPLRLAASALRQDWPAGGVGDLWLTDTRLAVWQLRAWHSLEVADIDKASALEGLSAGFNRVWAAAGPDVIPMTWYEASQPVQMDPVVALGTTQYAAALLGRETAQAQIPLGKLAMGGDIRSSEGHWRMCGIFFRSDGRTVLEEWKARLRDEQLYRWQDDADGSWEAATASGDAYLASIWAIQTLRCTIVGQ